MVVMLIGIGADPVLARRRCGVRRRRGQHGDGQAAVPGHGGSRTDRWPLPARRAPERLWVVGAGGCWGVMASSARGHATPARRVRTSEIPSTRPAGRGGPDRCIRALRRGGGGATGGRRLVRGRRGRGDRPRSTRDRGRRVLGSFQWTGCADWDASAVFFASSAGGRVRRVPDGLRSPSTAPRLRSRRTGRRSWRWSRSSPSSRELRDQGAGRPDLQPLRARPEPRQAAGAGLAAVPAQLTGPAESVYVSLDTLRDYLFVGDAARMVIAGLERVAERGGVHLRCSRAGRHVDRRHGQRGHQVFRRKPSTAGAHGASSGRSPGARSPPTLGRLARPRQPRSHPAARRARRRRRTPPRNRAGPCSCPQVHEVPGHRRRRLHRQPLRPHACSATPGGSPRPPRSRCWTSSPMPATWRTSSRSPTTAAALRRGRHPRPRPGRPADGRG